nr:15366_t:CDS:2 [Entrophospora candida]
MIMYWKSDAWIYGLNNKKKTHLSDAEINISTSEHLLRQMIMTMKVKVKFFINRETIPEDNCIILVENIGDYDNSDIDEYENANMTNEDGKGILDYDIDSLLDVSFGISAVLIF